MSQDVFRIDTSERDIQRRYEILKGAKWDLHEAKRMLCWVNTGFTSVEEIPKLITPEVGNEEFAGTGVRSP